MQRNRNDDHNTSKWSFCSSAVPPVFVLPLQLVLNLFKFPLQHLMTHDWAHPSYGSLKRQSCDRWWSSATAAVFLLVCSFPASSTWGNLIKFDCFWVPSITDFNTQCAKLWWSQVNVKMWAQKLLKQLQLFCIWYCKADAAKCTFWI